MSEEVPALDNGTPPSAEERAVERDALRLRRLLSSTSQRVGSGCLEWRGSLNDAGYGLIRSGGRAFRAHRIAYRLSVGPIPHGLLVDHECHNHACIDSDHLRLADRKRNAENYSGLRRNNKSGYQGVSWDTASGKWFAKLRHNRKQIAVGRFDTVEEAAEAVRLKRVELHTYNDLDRKKAS